MATGTDSDGMSQLGKPRTGPQDQAFAQGRLERNSLDSMIESTGPDGSSPQAASLTSTQDKEPVHVCEFDKQDGSKETKREAKLASATQPTEENILHRSTVIIGKTGVGKRTIAHVITTEKIFKVLNPVESMTREAQTVTASKKVGRYQYKFLLHDTVAQHRSEVHDEPTLGSFFRHLEKEFKDGVGLLVFVLRYGQESEIECNAFRYIIDRLKKGASECCALVVTGCETLSTAAKASYLEKLCKNELTRPVATFVKKDWIFLVSLPDMDEIEDDMQEKYREKKEISCNELYKLVHSPRRLWFPSELFKIQTKHYERGNSEDKSYLPGFLACLKSKGQK